MRYGRNYAIVRSFETDRESSMLQGKNIVVTGAESGIGRAIAIACAEAGARVCAAGLVSEGLKETIAKARLPKGASIVDFRVDIRDPTQVEALFDFATNGQRSLDAAVANAGVIALRPFEEITIEEWERVISVNLTGTFLTLSRASRILIRQGRGGSLIATGSSTAVRPISNSAAYIASKGGVHAMMQALALELGPHKIRVNTLVPGQTATPPLIAIEGYLDKAAKLLPLQEVAEPEELARYVVFALGDAAPHMTGTLLKVDSGRTIA
jgi:NAD(P)-dependent dehydrogenase (short-subunit alcohol dehydrogenase family)